MLHDQLGELEPAAGPEHGAAAEPILQPVIIELVRPCGMSSRLPRISFEAPMPVSPDLGYRPFDVDDHYCESDTRSITPDDQRRLLRPGPA